MELPRFLHPRYVPMPPPPPFSNDRNFHRLAPPLPPPPPPPPPQYRPVHAPPPPPPPYNPRQSQFTFLNPNPQIEDGPRRHLFEFANHSPRVSNRTLFDDDRPRLRVPEFDNSYSDNRPDMWDPSRVQPQNRFPILGFDHEPRHRHFNRDTLSPHRSSNKYRHELDGSSRFREEYNDGFKQNQSEEVVWGRSDCRGGSNDDSRHVGSHFVSNPRNFAGNSHVVSNSNPLREFVSNSGNYDSRRGSDDEVFWGSRGDERWGYARQPSRDVPRSSIEMEHEEIGDGDGFLLVSGKRVTHVSESGRFNNRGSREGAQEFNRTPRKKFQKKSAFLRIQMGKPSFRNRNDEECFSLAYFDESNPSTFRGKDPLVYSDDRMEDEREGSPVELDVSFKSNSLVAKAIVAPSSPAVVSDRDLTPRNRKIRKFVLPDMDFSTSQLTTVSEGVVKFDSSTHVANDPKQLEDKTTVSGIGTVRDLSSQPCSNGINVSPGKSTVEGSSKGRVSDKGGPNVGYDGMPLLNVRKKKKVMNPLSCSSSSQPTKIHGEPVNVDSSSPSPSAVLRSDEGVTHSKENITSVGMATMHNIVLQPCPNEVTVLPENNKVDESPQARVSEKVGTDIDSGRACVPKIKRKRNRLTPPFGTSSLEKTKIHGGPVNADRAVHVLHAISNSDKGLTISQDKTTLSDIGSADDASKQSSRNEVTVSHENRAEKCSSGARFLVGGNVNVGLSSSEEIKLHKGPVNKYSSNLGMNIASSSDNEIKTQEEITVSDIGMVDASRKQPCPKQVPISLENGIIGGFSKAMASSIVGSSNSEETIIQEGFINADNSNHGTGAASSSDNCLTNSQEKISVSSTGIMDDIGNQLPTDGVAISVENSAVEGSPKAIISVVGNHKVGSGKDYTPKIKRKRKVRTPQSDLSSSRITDIYVGAVNVASSARTVDTTSSSSIKDPSPAEAEVTASGVGSLDVGPQPCTDGVSVLHRNSSMDGFSEAVASVGGGVNVGLDGTPNKYKMKRKVFAPHPDLSSPTVAEVHEGPVIADTSTSGAEVPSNSNKGLTQSEEEVGVFSIGTLCTAGLLPFSNPSTILLENSVVGGSFEAVGPVTDGFSDDGLKLQHPSIDSCSIVQESAIRNVPSSCPSGLEGEQTENSTLVMATTIPQNYIMDTESGGRGEKMDEHAAEEHDMLRTETALYGIPFELQTPNLDQRLPSSDMECDSYLLVKDDLPSVSNYLSLRADVNGVPTTNPIDELMESEPDPLSNMGSPETTSIIPGLHRLNTKLSLGQISNEKVCGDDKELYEKPVVECGSVLFTSNSSSQSTNINLKTGHATESAHSITGKTVPLLSQDTKKTTKSMNPPGGESSVRKDQLSSAVPRVFPGRSSYVFTTSKKKPSSTHIAKPRTWHRTGNASASPLPGKNFFSSTVLPQRQSPKKIGKVQSTSYIRKGNSLVRKPAPVAALPHGSHMSSSSVYRLSPSDIDEIKKSTGSESMVDVVDPSNCLRTGGMNAPFERPKTPPLPNSTQLPNFTTVSSGDCTSSPLADPLLHGCAETTSDPAKSTESKDVPKFCEDAPKSSGTPENQTDAVNDLESQGVLNDGNLVSSKMKGIIYVKRKSNQLVAASNPCDLSVHNADKTQALSSDSYYKRSKNQLIRNINQAVAVPDDSSNSEGQMAPKVISNRSSSKRRSDKVLPKTFKPSKFSLVWTLCGTKSPRKDGNSLQRQKVLPHLFPWKRATSWRSFMDNSSFISNNSSLSMISRKLLLSRKRDTVYTRSTRGFSLRKSKVLSVGGSSLKWSKSIERHSKKASEEATLAVAAVERKKREQNGAACVISGTNSRNHSSRKSVHSVGLPQENVYSVLVRSDTKWILRNGHFRGFQGKEVTSVLILSVWKVALALVQTHGILPTTSELRSRSRSAVSNVPKMNFDDEESSGSAGLQSEKDPKKSYVPRRLVIGKDEYVRIGNGNQLIRDPKKRTRTLASEKVRWSLHTARLRLARKRKYCQFFTRFGKCNKDDGKCPYIHDPSKIAVCTKFLNSSCSNSNCKLTHKVIPERMQDCSYFLQGLCTNENCPYRHVNVNPKAFICEGFLRGYCADGNECRKKHTYVCPIFEATGICPQGSKCKLHHPKNRSNRRKRKHSREKKNARGRYFGSKHINIAEPGTAVSEKHSAPNNDDILFQEGRFSDYIRLDVSDKEAGETTDPTSEQVTLCDSDPSDVQLDDLDDLIKPIRIMN